MNGSSRNIVAGLVYSIFARTRSTASATICVWSKTSGGSSVPATGSGSADFERIARRQLSDEDSAARAAHRLLICDTDALATSIWHERYLGRRSPLLERLAAGRRYDLYRLTSDDIAFEQDGTRDGEHVRGWMTERFRQALTARAEPWAELRGDRAHRLALAVEQVDAMLARPLSTHPSSESRIR